MNKFLCMLMTLGLFMSTAASVAALEQKDNPQCKDHPLFTRLPTYWIHSCANKEFDSHAFFVGKDPATGKIQTEAVEGQLWDIRYYPQADSTSRPSELQILRNFENAVQKEGGSVVASDKSRETFKLVKDGKEYWVEVSTEFTGKYRLFVVRKEAMAQDVTVNAETLSKDIRSTGHVAVYGIYFDTGKSTIKPESADAIKEIAKLLQADAGLKVHVVGHTDNVGGIESNMRLSQARAGAVQQSLVSDHGIAADRLTAHGCGQFAPVASNDTEEGKSRNRRVELVKQ